MIGDDAFCDQCNHYADDVNFLLKSKDECLCMCHVYNEEILCRQRIREVLQVYNKMCDKCNIVYPELAPICPKCGNDRLRSFKIHNNMKELQKNWKNSGQTSIY